MNFFQGTGEKENQEEARRQTTPASKLENGNSSE